MRITKLRSVLGIGVVSLWTMLAACAPGASSSPDGGTRTDSGSSPDSGSSTDGGTKTDSGTAAAVGGVYTISNDTAGNQVYAYARAADGSLSLLGTYATGGKGTGADLGDQGALAYDVANKRFFVVNAGDSTISMMALNSDGSLTKVTSVAAGGTKPVSITFYGDIVYVLNAGDNATPGNITGFQVAGSTLTPLGSTQPLSSTATNIALGQIEFSRDGKVLVVTEKSTNKLDSYAVSATGIASAPKTVTADGRSPFGFEFSSNGYLIVSNENGGTNGSASSTSYSVAADATLTLVGSVGTGQTSSCWVATAGNYAYVSNTKSGNVSAYSVGADGKLTLIAGAAGTTGNGAIDLAVPASNDYLYVLAMMSHTVTVFKINADGTLTSKSTLSNLPTRAQGLVAR